LKVYEFKQTQTDETNANGPDLSLKLNATDNTINQTINCNQCEASMAESAQDKTVIDDLKLNLKIKENLIESINDALVLKEAEIARLKTRIGLHERKKLISEINENNDNVNN
jgi:hypothetical protein